MYLPTAMASVLLAGGWWRSPRSAAGVHSAHPALQICDACYAKVPTEPVLPSVPTGPILPTVPTHEPTLEAQQAEAMAI